MEPLNEASANPKTHNVESLEAGRVESSEGGFSLFTDEAGFSNEEGTAESFSVPAHGEYRIH